MHARHRDPRPGSAPHGVTAGGTKLARRERLSDAAWSFGAKLQVLKIK